MLKMLLFYSYPKLCCEVCLNVCECVLMSRTYPCKPVIKHLLKYPLGCESYNEHFLNPNECSNELCESTKFIQESNLYHFQRISAIVAWLVLLFRNSRSFSCFILNLFLTVFTLGKFGLIKKNSLRFYEKVWKLTPLKRWVSVRFQTNSCAVRVIYKWPMDQRYLNKPKIGAGVKGCVPKRTKAYLVLSYTVMAKSIGTLGKYEYILYIYYILFKKWTTI